MAPIVVTARIVCKDREARKTVLQAFHKIVEFTEPNEPGVLRYIVTLPIDDTTGTVLYMIEEYASNSANDAHIAIAPVQDLITLFTTTDVLAQPPEVHTSFITSARTSSPPPLITPSTTIHLSHVPYAPGTLTHALKGWSLYQKYVSDNEPGTKGYTICEEKERNCVRIVAVFENEGAVEKAGRENWATRANEEHNGKNRLGGVETVRVRPVDGFLGRGDAGRGRL